MKNRVVLHSDLNNFYAAVECLYRPEIRAKPVAVCGEPELRHGIVLAKNQLARRQGVETGQVIHEAQAKCPELVIVPPHQSAYERFSGWAREIYEQYADNIESYGLDESWLEITNLARDEYDGQAVADEIRAKMKETLGITCSVGVSFNKVYAKLASDLRKPDCSTVISRQKYKEIVWPMPPDKLLGVNTKIAMTLRAMGITDIGNIAKAPVELLEGIFGKNGRTLHRYASGEDNSPVSHKDYVEPPKSVGHTETTHRDMENAEDVRRVVYALSEKVASRMRAQHFKCRTIQVSIRENDLKWRERQGTLEVPTFIANTIAEKALEIFGARHKFAKPLRSIGVRACNLVPDTVGIQGSFFDDPARDEKMERLAGTVDTLRAIYGYGIIRRGIALEDEKLTYVPPDYDRSAYRVGSAFFKEA